MPTANVKDDQGGDSILKDHYIQTEIVSRIASMWDDVGLELDIPQYQLEGLTQMADPCGSKCKALLSEWFNRDINDPVEKRRPIWKNIYEAMLDLEMGKGAKDLKDEIEDFFPN